MSMSMLEPVVAVIGGGAIATSFIRQLADCATRGGMRRIASVCVFEPHESPGAGDGCTNPHPSAWLDAAAASMSVLRDEPLHFFDWVMQHQAQWHEMHPGLVLHPQAHLPRALFGRYLEAVYGEAVTSLRNAGVAVHHIRSAVKAVQPLKPLQVPCAEHAVVTESGATYAANAVVLASTNTDATAFEHLRHHTGYWRWSRQAAAGELGLDATASVVILGSGASAVDAAIALEDAGHRGRITVASRSGSMPLGAHSAAQVELPSAGRFSREAIQAWAQQRGGKLRLAEVGELLLRHFNAASTGPAGSGSGGLRELRERTWQAIASATADSADLIWHLLPTHERRVVDRDFKSEWLTHRAPLPAATAQRISALLASQQVVLRRGLASVRAEPSRAGFEIDLVERDAGHTPIATTLHATHLIDATDSPTDLTRCRSPLLRSLLASGQARPHEFGGLDVDFDTSRLIARNGTVQASIHALGSIVSGTYFWTGAMGINARLAAGVARFITESRGDAVAPDYAPRGLLPAGSAAATLQRASASHMPSHMPSHMALHAVVNNPPSSEYRRDQHACTSMSQLAMEAT